MISTMRRTMVALLSTSLLAGLAACSNQGVGVPTPQAPGSSTQSASSSIHKPALQVTPSSLTFTSPSASAQTFVASVQFAGNMTAQSSNTGVATVSPGTATPTEPVNGTSYSATFTVTPVAVGTATITVTDKKGDTASVSVTVSGTPDVTLGPPATFVENNNGTILYAYHFGQVASAGPIGFPVTNTGNAATTTLTLTPVDPHSGFSSFSDCSGQSLAAGTGTCTIGVSWAASAVSPPCTSGQLIGPVTINLSDTKQNYLTLAVDAICP